MTNTTPTTLTAARPAADDLVVGMPATPAPQGQAIPPRRARYSVALASGLWVTSPTDQTTERPQFRAIFDDYLEASAALKFHGGEGEILADDLSTKGPRR